MSNESFENLKKYLMEMFQFDENDLDFGLFKIYKLKSAEIKKFIEGTGSDSLNALVSKSFEKISLQSQKAKLTELEIFLSKTNKQSLLLAIKENKDKIISFINTADTEEEKKSLLQTLDSVLNNGDIKEEFQNKIYNYILDFFGLYYYNGDFGYNDRSIAPFKVEYDEDYDGSDTMLFWKHKNQYYIKTGNGFNSIRFDLYGQKMFRLETNEQSEDTNQSQNNNKDTSVKHYALNRIELDDDDTHRVIFNLAKSSTSKADIIKRILTEAEFTDANISFDNIEKYLFDADGKSIFKDLTDDCYKVQEGAVKGLGSLKVTKEAVLKKINTNFDRANKIDEEDELFKIIYNLDRRLNTFYVGNDSDFFIHKDLNGFLTKEKEKFVKNHILSDLNAIYNCQTDNTSLIIAQSFDEIVSIIIGFLGAAEEFQKKLFLKKKKVVVSEYCLTVDNIDESNYSEIIGNEIQKQEWVNLGFVENETEINKEYLVGHPTLVVDTKFYTPEFKDKLLGSIDNLEEKTQGLLINSENFQALNLLQDKYRGKVKCIYIDPPYNTGSDGFAYKDNFKNSSWLSMIKNRIQLANNILSDNGLLFVSINDIEYSELKILLTSTFPEVTTIVVKMSEKSGLKMSHSEQRLPKQKEYVVVCKKKTSTILNPLIENKSSSVINKYLKYYSKIIENPKDAVEKWRILSLKDYFEKNNLKLKESEIKQFKIDNAERIIYRTNNSFLNGLTFQTKTSKVLSPEGIEYVWWEKKQMLFLKDYLTETRGDLWVDISTINLNKEGGVVLKSGKKPEKLIQKLIELSTTNNDLVMDFFAGSGTTCAVSQKMKNKWIGVEMENYYESITKPRIINVLFGDKGGITQNLGWKGGGIFKYQTFEQYEDLINRIEVGEEMPENLPLSYLYKPEEYLLDSNLDINKPFDNTVLYGKNNTESKVDLIETYNYLKGYEVKSIKSFTENNKYYKVLEVGRTGNYSTLQIWRDISDQEIMATSTINQDLENIKKIILNYSEIDSIEVNYGLCHVAKGFELGGGQLTVSTDRNVDTKIITKDEFEE
jgi:adenine-specific DNA-methyltransferase